MKYNENNNQWKGDDVGMKALHDWIRRRKLKPNLCECCKKRKPKDLANISGKYKRDVNDFEWLCRKCHMEKDGRKEKFLYHKKSFEKGNQLYKKVKNRLRGEKAPWSKLKDNQVKEIKEKYKTGKYTLLKLANEYGVCFQNISLIVNNKTRS